MRHLLSLFIFAFISLTSGQQYAERNPIPADTLPILDDYDYDATDGYDFNDEQDIYRWNINDYPHPRENPRYCNRLKPSNICDPDSVLEKEQADRLDSFIKSLYQETPCICDTCEPGEGGIVIGIALLKHMYQPYNEHPSKIIRRFSESLRAKWKLGKCDNDILIVVAVTDRLSYTDVGKATSSYVSLNEAHRIFLENKAHFTAGHFFEGLRAMLADYHESTRDMKRPVEKGLDIALISGSIIGAVVLLGVVLFIAFIVYRRCKMEKPEKRNPDEKTDNRESVSSSWTKQDIKVMFSSLKGTAGKQMSSPKYQPCETDEKDANPSKGSDDEIIDVTLAIPEDNNETQLTTVSGHDESTSEMLEKDLNTATEDLAKTFATVTPRPTFRGHMTDL
ncbi:uncharacterized protein LOC129225608 [Uloborus diversus]|uniref:uncharacterized protein LOC129225608 n=1 Tax=Uloborus diversus TaxID=327109 RepID=UPI0024094256|nr:uncharacterized protein LOC129225608 [Uloborus diversus]XP_054716045.1 uncharacterized protein LOC129225608 [Uloborus diversus]XP_054716047.1 uncharacterized protein LOC129225608 [Uloborus diversus]